MRQKYDNLDAAQQRLDQERRDFYRAGTRHGEITGTGPGFDDAMRKFKKRQERLKQPGKWRQAPTPWKKDNGDYIDVHYYLVDWDYLL